MYGTFALLRRAAPALAALICVPAQAADRPAATLSASCLLLEAAEVAAAVGHPVEPGRLLDNGVTAEGARSRTCLWLGAAADGAGAGQSGKPFGGRSFVILSVMEWSGPAGSAGKFLDSFRKAYAAGVLAAAPVPVDVGADEALWWGDGVAAWRGAVSYGVSVASPGDRALRRPRAEALARLIAARLPPTLPARAPMQ